MSRFVSLKEFSELTTLSISTVNRRLKDGTIPCIRIGNRVLISLDYVQTLFVDAAPSAKATIRPEAN